MLDRRVDRGKSGVQVVRIVLSMRRLESINLLRGIAAFGIVGCHLQLAPMSDSGMFVRQLCDMNVGLFAALSGFLMWPGVTKGVWFDYAKKRSMRILPTYFVWTLVYVLFGFAFDFCVRHGVNPKWSSPSFVLSVFLKGNASCHLWFLICLLYAQLIVAAFVRTTGAVKPRIFGVCCLVLSFVIIVCLNIQFGNFYLYYPARLLAFLLGGVGVRCLVGEEIATNARRSCLWFALAAMGIVIHYQVGALHHFIRDWVVAMPLLMAFVYLPMRESRVVRLAGEISMGVFLVHPILAAGLALVVKRFFAAPFGAGVVCADWVICWGAAIAIAILAIRVPVLKRFWI